MSMSKKYEIGDIVFVLKYDYDDSFLNPFLL